MDTWYIDGISRRFTISNVQSARLLFWVPDTPKSTWDPYIKMNLRVHGPSTFHSNATTDMSQTHQILPRTPYFLIFCKFMGPNTNRLWSLCSSATPGNNVKCHTKGDNPGLYLYTRTFVLKVTGQPWIFDSITKRTSSANNTLSMILSFALYV